MPYNSYITSMLRNQLKRLQSHNTSPPISHPATIKCNNNKCSNNKCNNNNINK